MNGKPNLTGSQGVWKGFHRRLRAFVSRRVKSAADTEDIVQEIFIRIHRNLGGLNDQDRLPAWVFAIARNAVADHFRKNSQPVDSLPEDFDVAAEQESDPEATAVNELSRCLEPMIEALPPSYREAIRLTEIEGMTQSEAAAHEKLSVSGMKTRVQRGRRKLKDMLLQCCEIESDRLGGIVSYEPRDGRCTRCPPDKQDSPCTISGASDDKK